MIKGVRLKRFVVYIIRILLVIAIVIESYTQNWPVLSISLITLFLTFIPTIVERKYHIDIPEWLEILIVIFIYASLYLGEIQSYYIKFWWWDIMLHALAALALGFIGFIILFVLYQEGRIKAKPGWITFYSFTFVLAMGTLWEIFEFLMDISFGLNMQKSGLVDTMIDLIVDSIGAFIASFIGYIYLKKGKILDGIVDDFVGHNPKLFKKIR